MQRIPPLPPYEEAMQYKRFVIRLRLWLRAYSKGIVLPW